ncbi:PAS domain S-box-containing protein/diguanylate cyclase (GGDEF) domain-containing protein [Sporobacter termitidis DSM 10068]|uniref:PAS domain S-box-containing protein/diguanylate cyclase (GGDEF) domain-containing protein n=1 Tax=Sporobacter termitidis DSM 10068 TaxID=1123282 RepID=A0A1M5TWE5_9FIRM|nr:sensor domain-containing diguanylate cyclase [Sporobacter termitidis]SHH54926.1 PAS domain S-box-containing protein/diguanylate cyclase (GGDEF) domain-containing protein [Sporobacter termitidis DSM 10068]
MFRKSLPVFFLAMIIVSLSAIFYAAHTYEQTERLPGQGIHAAILLSLLAVLAVTIAAFVIVFRGQAPKRRPADVYPLTMSIPSGICRIENFETGRIIFANEFYYGMFGYTEEEARLGGFTTADFTVVPEDLAALKENIRQNFTLSINWYETEVRHVRKDGEVIWTLSRYSRDRSLAGSVTVVMIDITDRKRMEEKLRISEEEYRIATLHSNKHILRLDIRTRISYHQTSLPPVFDVPPVLENVPESIISSGAIAQDSADAFRGFFDTIYRGEREGSVVVSAYDRGAEEYRWYHFDFTSIFDDGGKPAQAIISFYDVTLQRQKELAFQRWQQTYNAIPKSATNYYEYNLTDDRFEHEEGGMFPPLPRVISRKLRDVTSFIARRHIYKEDANIFLTFMSRDRLLENYASGHHTDKTEFRRLADGMPKWTSISVQLIPDPYSPDVKGYFLLEDIDERKKAELSLQERSTLDSLTGLLNRATFIEKFTEILQQSESETQHALIMLDIDNFKTINDTLGHSAGDALLLSIAGKLKYALRTDDLCGRLGGDEFVICLKSMNLGKPLETRVSDLCHMICDERSWGVSVSASFGIAGFPYDGLTFDELYKKADIALYRAKAQGRGRFAVYDPQLSFDDIAAAVKQP